MGAPALVEGDIAGGEITPAQSWGRIDGARIVVVGSDVAAHGFHFENAMAVGSMWGFIDGVPICRQGDAAACGHTGVASNMWFDCP